jgi:hypothetical protein
MPDRTQHGKRSTSGGHSQGERNRKPERNRDTGRSRAGVNPSGEDLQARAELVRDHVEMLVAKHGSAEEALRVLGGDNVDYRRKLRELNEQVDELEELIPPDGAVVLTGDDAKGYTAIVEALKTRSDKLTLDKVPARLTRADELEVKLVGSEHKATVTTAAQSSKFNSDVLAGLVDDPRNPLALELRDMTVQEGAKQTTVKVPYVRKANDEKAAWEKLSDFAEREWKPWLPALKNVSTAQGASGTSGSGGGTGTTHGGGGSDSVFTPFPEQTGSSQGGGTDTVSKFIASQREQNTARNNPLRAKPATTTQGTSK